MSRPSHKDRDFTPEQEKAIELLARGGLRLKDIAEEVGCSEKTLYTWRKLPEFMEQVVVRSREIIKEELPDIYQTLTDKCKDGSHHHIKILLDHLADLEQMRAKANQGQITFTWDIDAD